jgi:hypothetical protein
MSIKDRLKKWMCSHEWRHRIRYDYERMAYVQSDVCVKCRAEIRIKETPLPENVRTEILKRRESSI